MTIAIFFFFFWYSFKTVILGFSCLQTFIKLIYYLYRQAPKVFGLDFRISTQYVQYWNYIFELSIRTIYKKKFISDFWFHI